MQYLQRTQLPHHGVPLKRILPISLYGPWTVLVFCSFLGLVLGPLLPPDHWNPILSTKRAKHWLAEESLFPRLVRPSSTHGMPRLKSSLHLSQQVHAASSDKWSFLSRHQHRVQVELQLHVLVQWTQSEEEDRGFPLKFVFICCLTRLFLLFLAAGVNCQKSFSVL